MEATLSQMIRSTPGTGAANRRNLGAEVERVLATKLMPVRGPIRTEFKPLDPASSEVKPPEDRTATDRRGSGLPRETCV